MIDTRNWTDEQWGHKSHYTRRIITDLQSLGTAAVDCVGISEVKARARLTNAARHVRAEITTRKVVWPSGLVTIVGEVS